MPKGPRGKVFNNFSELPDDLVANLKEFSTDASPGAGIASEQVEQQQQEEQSDQGIEIVDTTNANKRFSTPEEKEARRLERMNKKKTLKKANFSDPDEIIVRMPDENNINAADLDFEKEAGIVNEVSPSEIADDVTPVEEEINDPIVGKVEDSAVEAPVKVKNTESKAPENIGARAGGASQRKKAAELLKQAQEKDPILTKEKRPEENIEGEVLQFEKELRELSEEDILEAETLDELLLKIDASKGIQGKLDYFNQGLLRTLVEEVRDGKLTLDYITRTNHLRDKVFELLGSPAHMAEPTPGVKNSAEVETPTEPEIVIEETPVLKAPDFSGPEDVTKRAGYQRMPIPIPSSQIKKMTPPPTPEAPKLPDAGPYEFSTSTPDNPSKPKVQKNPTPVLPEGYAEKKNEGPRLRSFSEYEGLDVIKEINSQIVQANNYQVIAENELGVLNKKLNNVFKRFFFKLKGDYKDRYQAVYDKAKDARKKQKQLIDKKIDAITSIRVEEISQLPVSSPDRKPYEFVEFKDVEKTLLKNLVDLEIEYGQGKPAPDLYSLEIGGLKEESKVLKFTFDTLLKRQLLDENEVAQLRSKLITKKVKEEVRKYVVDLEDIDSE